MSAFLTSSGAPGSTQYSMGLTGIAHGGVGILLDQAVTPDVVDHHGLADGNAVIHVAEPAVTGARIVHARRIAGAGQFDQGIMFAQSDRFGRWRHAAHGAGEHAAAESAAAAPAASRRCRAGGSDHDGRRSLRGSGAATAAPARAFIGEREGHLHLGILREGLGAGQIDGAARAVHAICRAARGEPSRRAHAVAHEEIRGIDQHMAVAFGSHREAPQNGPGERVFHRAPLRRIGTGRAEGLIALHHQNARTNALEGDDAPLAFDAAVEPDIVGAEPGGETVGEQEVRIEARNLEPQIARALVPIEREIAIDFVHAGNAFFDGGYAAAGNSRAPAAPALLGLQGQREYSDRKGE